MVCIDERKVKRLQQNRVSALKCRQKKKEHFQKVIEERDSLAQQNEAFKAKIDEFEKRLQQEMLFNKTLSEKVAILESQEIKQTDSGSSKNSRKKSDIWEEVKDENQNLLEDYWLWDLPALNSVYVGEGNENLRLWNQQGSVPSMINNQLASIKALQILSDPISFSIAQKLAAGLLNSNQLTRMQYTPSHKSAFALPK